MKPLLPREEFGPPHSEYAVIWLHGLGASGHDFVPIMPELELTRTRFIFPHAPVRPVTVNHGYPMPSWYDILRVDTGPGRESEPDILESTKRIHDLIDAEVNRGISAHKIILCGFSQGGAMALHAGVRYSEPLAGIVVLSAYDLRESQRAAEIHPRNSNTPILFCHGRQDGVVNIDKGKSAYSFYSNTQRSVQWHEFQMGHEVCASEVQCIKSWINQVLRT